MLSCFFTLEQAAQGGARRGCELRLAISFDEVRVHAAEPIGRVALPPTGSRWDGYYLPSGLFVRLDHSTASSAVIMKLQSGQEWPADWKAWERTKENANNGDGYEYSDSDEGF